MVLCTVPRQPMYVALALLGALEQHHVWQKYSYA